MINGYINGLLELLNVDLNGFIPYSDNCMTRR